MSIHYNVLAFETVNNISTNIMHYSYVPIKVEQIMDGSLYREVYFADTVKPLRRKCIPGIAKNDETATMEM